MNTQRTRIIRIALLTGVMLLALAWTVSAAELRFLAVGHPATMNNYLIGDVFPEFEKKHGVKVIVDTADWNTRMDKIMVSIAGGVPYDVVATAYYSPYEEGSLGLLTPLDRYVEQWDKRDRFPAPLWEATKWKGRIYHVPHNNDLRGIAYNKRLFAQAGLDAEQPPQSWEELINVTRILTTMEGDRIGVRGFTLSNTPSGAAQQFFWFMRQAGIPEIDVETFTSNLNRIEARDALHTLVELAEASRFREPAVSGGFVQGRVAMQQQTSMTLYTLSQENPDILADYGVFAPRRSPDMRPVAHGFVNGLAILEESTNKDLAWLLIDAMHDDQVRLEMERSTGFLSGRLDMLAPMMEFIPKVELYYGLFNYLQATMIPPPRNVAQQELGQRIVEVFNMQMAPEAALTQGHELWTRLLKEWESTF